MKRMLMPLCLGLVALPAAATAQELRDFCGDRPGLGTPPCTVDPGHVQIEAGLADWTLDKRQDSRTDTILAGDFLARIGIGEATEARFGWTSYGHVRVRDRASGSVERHSGVGDVTVGIKQNLARPDGSALSIALLPYATLPVGRQPVGEGDWSTGLLVPLSYEIANAVTMQATPELDAAVDEDGHGRHLAYGSVIGISDALTETLSVAGEFQALRDRDPSGHHTQALAGLSFAWQPQAQTQLDVGSNVGLNHASPDAQFYLGISRKF